MPTHPGTLDLLRRAVAHYDTLLTHHLAAADACAALEPLLAAAFTGTTLEVLAAHHQALTQAITDQLRTTQSTRTHLAQLLTRLENNPGAGPDARPSAAGTPSAQPDRPAQQRRVADARARIGRRNVSTATRGEWIRPDGWSAIIHSGMGDDLHQQVVDFVAAELLPADRRAARLARHVEIKIAVEMRRTGQREAIVVVDKSVCGTRDFDREEPYTCDKMLPRFLPPGARLHVVLPDGPTITYEGTERL